MPEQTTIKERSPHIPGLDAEANTFLGIGLGLTGLALGLRPKLAPLPIALTALTAMLYRDPERTTPNETDTLFAVSDGIVQHIDEVYEHRYLHTDCLRIVTMRSPIDVSVNRSPVDGEVRYLEYVSGEFRPLNDPQAPERNTRLYIGLDSTWGPLMIVQIASPIARRIISPIELGERLEAGGRIGTVRFGARVDLIVQRDSIELLLGAGERVLAGVSRVACIVPL